MKHQKQMAHKISQPSMHIARINPIDLSMGKIVDFLGVGPIIALRATGEAILAVTGQDSVIKFLNEKNLFYTQEENKISLEVNHMRYEFLFAGQGTVSLKVV